MDRMSRELVENVLSLLVAGDFQGIERLSNGERLTAKEIEDAVREYGRTLIRPPSGDFEIEEIALRGPGLTGWSVVCELWSREEGRSDLSLELTVLRKSDCAVVEVDNLRVR